LCCAIVSLRRSKFKLTGMFYFDLQVEIQIRSEILFIARIYSICGSIGMVDLGTADLINQTRSCARKDPCCLLVRPFAYIYLYIHFESPHPMTGTFETTPSSFVKIRILLKR